MNQIRVWQQTDGGFLLRKLDVLSSREDEEDEEDESVWTAELTASAACYHDVLPLHFVFVTCRSCWASWRPDDSSGQPPRRLRFAQLSRPQPHDAFDRCGLTLGSSDESRRTGRGLKGTWGVWRGTGWWSSWPVQRSHEEVCVHDTLGSGGVQILQASRLIPEADSHPSQIYCRTRVTQCMCSSVMC